MQCRADKTNIQEASSLSSDIKKLLWMIGFIFYCVSGYLTQMIPPYSGFAWAGVIVFGTLLVIFYVKWGELHES